MLAPNFPAMPAELRNCPRWVAWKLFKGNKVPFSATAHNNPASVVDPCTWATFEQAQAAYEEGGYSGVGVVLTNDDSIVGVDLDKCVVDGTPAAAAMNLMDRIGCAYVELSPSGLGLRGFGYGDDIGGTRGALNGVNVELYSRARYLTVTGRPLISGPFIQMPAFAEVASEIKGKRYTEEDRGGQKKTQEILGPLLSSSVDSIAIPLRTVPQGEGERHRFLFEFARHIKAVRPNATWPELRVLAARWHALALPAIATKEFAVTLDEFARAFEKVRIPHGDVLHSVVGSIEHDAALPAGIEALRYGHTAKRLVRLCMALAAHHEPEPFFLDVRTAAQYLEVNHTYAWKLLSTFVRDGLLEVISKGAGYKATRYRFAWS